MEDKYEPIGYVPAAAYWDGGYVPLVHFYEPGRPMTVVWVGRIQPSISDAIRMSSDYVTELEPPGREELQFALRRVLDIIGNAGNLMAVTANEEVAAARTLVAKLGRMTYVR